MLDCIVEPLLRAGVEVHVVPRPGTSEIHEACAASWPSDKVIVRALPLEPYAATVVAAARGYDGPVIAIDSDVLVPHDDLTRFAETASGVQDRSLLGISADPIFRHPKTLWVSESARPRMWNGSAPADAWRSASAYIFSPEDMARLALYAATGATKFSPFLMDIAETAAFYPFEFAININTRDDLRDASTRLLGSAYGLSDRIQSQAAWWPRRARLDVR